MSDEFPGEYQHLLTRQVGKVVVASFNRPEAANALNYAMESEFYRLLRNVDKDDGVSAVVLTAVGNMFSAGHDIQQVADEMVGGAEPPKIDGKNWSRTGELTPPWWFSKALVVAVSGFVGPHANTILLSADFVVAAENTKFSWEESRVGVGVPFGSYALMPFHFPMRVLKHLWVSGGWMDAETARALFYVNRVVPLGDEEGEAMRFAMQVSRMNMTNFTANKVGIHKLYEALGLLSMVDSGREPFERHSTSQAEILEHFRLIYEHGVGAAVRKRDEGWDSDIAKV